VSFQIADPQLHQEDSGVHCANSTGAELAVLATHIPNANVGAWSTTTKTTVVIVMASETPEHCLLLSIRLNKTVVQMLS
jgi:hypothetical protein